MAANHPEKRFLRVKSERLGVKNARELRAMNFEAGFGPNHVVSHGRFLRRRPLGSEAAIDIDIGPASLVQSGALSRLRTGHANDKVKFAFRVGFE